MHYPLNYFSSITLSGLPTIRMAAVCQWRLSFLYLYLVVALPALSALQSTLTGGVLAKGEKVCVFLWETAHRFP